MKKVKEYPDPKNEISYAYAITRTEWKELKNQHHFNFLFDLDQTLLNFHASEYIALKIIVTQNGFDFSDQLYDFFKVRNKELWLELEKEKITRSQLFETRFKLLFEKCGADTSKMDLLKINSDFINEMARNGVLMDGALDFVKKLSGQIKNARIYIITNGAVVNAQGRLESTGLNQYIKETFVSEAMAYSKPAKEYFDIVLSKIDEPKENCIVIGDSLSSDMLGAKNAGLTSCWFMPQGEIEKSMKDYDIEYKADNFDELFEVLKTWAKLKESEL
jgi:YjjG family noncanonical pyrimidine nucleotidase